MIKIDTVAFITPSTFRVELIDGDKAGGSYRTASYRLVRERKRARMRKLYLTYRIVSESDLSTALQQIAGESFTVEYPDPYDGALRSGTFYVGNRNIGVSTYISGTPIYKDVTFNFIEY